MGKFIDLTNEIFDRLRVIKRAENHIQPNGMSVVMWECECECGNKIIVDGMSLRRKKTKSCGCFHKESARKQGQKNKKYNKYDLTGDFGIGYTIKGEVFYFDLEDYDKIKDYCWYKSFEGYIVSNIVDDKHYTIRLHRIILNPEKRMQVDHINHILYDNRKQNLRIVTNSQNSMNRRLQSNNTSGIVGVSYYDNSWNAEIIKNGKKFYLGSFTNKEDAIKVRKEAEEKYFGEYSYDNSMKGDENNEQKSQI